MEKTALFLIFCFNLFANQVVFSQTNDCEMLRTKIQKSFAENTTFRVSTRNREDKNYPYINYEIDSNSNRHLVFSQSGKEAKQNAIIWIGSDVYYSGVGKSMTLGNIWMNKIPQDVNYSDCLAFVKNAENIFNQPLTKCYFLKELKYITCSYKVYEVSIEKDNFKVWINSTIDKVERIMETSGKKSRSWFFNIPFEISSPNTLDTTATNTGFNVFQPVYVSDETITGDDYVYEVVDKKSEFKGGEEGMFKHLAGNIKYPVGARVNRVQGDAIIRFVIEKDGSVTNVKSLHKPERDLEEEIIRVVKLMDKKWITGIYKGKKVRTSYTLPYRFRLE